MHKKYVFFRKWIFNVTISAKKWYRELLKIMESELLNFAYILFSFKIFFDVINTALIIK